jgi:hypothetical protein
MARDVYLDIANIDRYNLILRMKFMYNMNIILDIWERTMYVGGYDGCRMKAMQPEEEQQLLIATHKHKIARSKSISALKKNLGEWPHSGVEHSKEPIPVSLMTIDEKQEIAANDLHELLSQEERDTIIESLRKQWKEKYKHLFGGAPPGLLPFQEVNHSIPLMDENKQYNYCLPKCADAFEGFTLSHMFL